MTNSLEKSRSAAKPELDAPLTLDKETLKDLEPTLTDSEAVKGGAWPTLAGIACATYSCFLDCKAR